MGSSHGTGRPGAGTPSSPARHVLVIGERGVGKRTIVNALVGRAALPSGLEVDRREEPHHAEHDGVRYSVVQGVCGNAARAEALTRVLRCGSPESLVLFVMKIEKKHLDQKRVSFDLSDLATMRAVLMAVPSITTYGVVVHAHSQEVRESEALRRQRELLDAAMVIIPPARRTPFLFFQGFSPRLHEAAASSSRPDFGCIGADFTGLWHFVLSELRPCRIKPRAVKAVTAAGWERIRQDFDTLKGECSREAVQRTQVQLSADGFPDFTYAEPEGFIGDPPAWSVARTWSVRVVEPVRESWRAWVVEPVCGALSAWVVEPACRALVAWVVEPVSAALVAWVVEPVSAALVAWVVEPVSDALVELVVVPLLELVVVPVCGTIVRATVGFFEQAVRLAIDSM